MSKPTAAHLASLPRARSTAAVPSRPRPRSTSMPLSIPNDYGYVIGAVGAAFVPLSYGAYRVVVARKKYNVKYPDLVRARGRERRARRRARRG